MLIKPKILRAGDTIAITSHSWGGASVFPHRFEAGKKRLEEVFGLKVVTTPHALESEDFLYNNPKIRAEDINWAIKNPDIKAIFSMIGGDDAVRILPYLDYEAIRDNPKLFIGYSDATSVHFAFLKAGVSSVYGPSIMAEFAENGEMFDYLIDSVMKTLFSSEIIGEIKPNYDGYAIEKLNWKYPELQNRKRKQSKFFPWKFINGRGKVEGHLVGGCIEVMDMLHGTPYFPTPDYFKDAILFIETSEDNPDPNLLRYWLRSYGVSGILANLNGIILGRPYDTSPDKINLYDEAVLDVVVKEFGLDIPIITQMDFGHTTPQFCIPYGLKAQIDVENNKFSILGSYKEY